MKAIRTRDFTEFEGLRIAPEGKDLTGCICAAKPKTAAFYTALQHNMKRILELQTGPPVASPVSYPEHGMAASETNSTTPEESIDFHDQVSRWVSGPSDAWMS